ncbi:MAG: glycosyltransferase family 39 protein [Chthoniobacterales bacterium]
MYGINWGLESGYGHYLNFQPDEFISMRGMLPIDIFKGKLQAPGAYFEGTFNYYLWSIPETLHRLITGAPPLRSDVIPVDRCAFILLTGRLLTVVFDLATIIGLYAIILALTTSRAAALLGSFVYGILPMQVIYAHFMRTHVLSNLLCVGVIWLSLIALKHRRWWLYVAAGLVAGLGGATRYPVAVILSIPFFLVLFAGQSEDGHGLTRLTAGARRLLVGPVWFLAAGFVFGLFLGAPMLFLDFRTVAHTISTETLHYVPPGATKMFDFTPLLKYFSTLIPYASYPLLWIVLYLAAAAVFLRRSLWPIVLPLFLFSALYTYPMAKGYIVVFARQVMLLLPVFCIFLGLAAKFALDKTRERPSVVRGLAGLITLLILPTVAFDVAYDRAMSRGDVRETLRHDLTAVLKDTSSATIGVSESGGYFYTVMPAVFPLNGGRVEVRLQKASEPADYFVVGFERPLADGWRQYQIKQVEKAGMFRFVKSYSRSPHPFGMPLDISEFPPDMTYPFPMILLFRKAGG